MSEQIKTHRLVTLHTQAPRPKHPSTSCRVIYHAPERRQPSKPRLFLKSDAICWEELEQTVKAGTIWASLATASSRNSLLSQQPPGATGKTQLPEELLQNWLSQGGSTSAHDQPVLDRWDQGLNLEEQCLTQATTAWVAIA